MLDRLTPDAVGARVVVRRRLPDGAYGDVLGELEAWSDGLLRIRRRDGSLVEVDETTVVAAKPVPPAPPRRP